MGGLGSAGGDRSCYRCIPPADQVAKSIQWEEIMTTFHYKRGTSPWHNSKSSHVSFRNCLRAKSNFSNGLFAPTARIPILLTPLHRTLLSRRRNPLSFFTNCVTRPGNMH